MQTTTYAHKNRFSLDGFMDFAPSPGGSLSEKITGYIDRRLVEKNEQEVTRDYLGGSRLGLECQRQLYYEFHKTPKDPGRGFSGRILRRFRFGHAQETDSIELLRLAGFEVISHNPDGSQIGWSTAGGRMRGHIDGIIVSGPVKLPYPLLFEHKILAHKYFVLLATKGVRAAKPVYFGQVQGYMGYMALDNALFMGYDTDTSELYFELIPLDVGYAQKMSDNGVAILTAPSADMVARITRDPNDYRCKHLCDYPGTCWRAS